jgi:RNA polymerase sigma factor (sigma-70 family)
MDTLDVAEPEPDPGSADLMGALFSEHARALVAYAGRLLRDPYAAEDVVQEALLRAWQHQDRLDNSEHSLRNWLFTVTRHLIIDRVRSAAVRYETVGAENVEVALPDCADVVITSIEAETLLQLLSPEHRAVVTHRYLYGRTTQETAQVLGIPAGTVKSRQHHALSALRKLVASTSVAAHSGDAASGPELSPSGSPAPSPARRRAAAPSACMRRREGSPPAPPRSRRPVERMRAATQNSAASPEPSDTGRRTNRCDHRPSGGSIARVRERHRPGTWPVSEQGEPVQKKELRRPTRRRVAMAVAAGSGAFALSLAGIGQADAAVGGARTTTYTALGDSYASAPGVAGQVDSTCARSDHNYPSLTAQQKQWRLTDVSCSGATTADMAGSQSGVAPQLTAVTGATDVVSVTIGGNDIGFSTDLATCAGLTSSNPAGAPCRDHFTADGTDQLAARVDQTGSRIAAVLRDVHRQAPHARVLVVGYPDLFPDDGVGCTSSTVPLAAGDFPYLRDTEKKLNAMLAREALLGGARYVDTYTPTIGHDMCRPDGQRWIEPLVTAPPVAPAHPNAQGEAAMSAAVVRTLSCVLPR